MIKLYDFPLSGHAHRVRLMLSLLDLEYENIFVDLATGEHLEQLYSALNPFHQVPVLDDDGFIIRDSVAILCYLASKYNPQWYPQHPKLITRVQEWLAVATKEIAEGPASARLVTVFKADLDHKAVIQKSHNLLTIVNNHLKDKKWLSLDQATIADVAAYTYIAHAPEGGVSLMSYSNIRTWLSRIEALPGFIAMEKTSISLAS